MKITITIPDDQYQDVLDSFAQTPFMGAERVSTEEMFLNQVGIFIQTIVKAYKVNKQVEIERERIQKENTYDLTLSTDTSSVSVEDPTTQIESQ